jgi:hypothetical protein
MRAARWRLAIAAALFFGWISWLAYLAFTTTRPVVLSRPQFMISTWEVIAQVSSKSGKPDPEVTVAEVYSSAPGSEKLTGRNLTVANLPACDGWQGPGSYILPLVNEGDAYQVPTLPLSPGYIPSRTGERPRIYPATADTLAQLAEMHKK